MNCKANNALCMNGKRFIDLFLTLVIIIALNPMIVILSILIFLNIGWPVFFIQKRPGLYGRAFKLIKFRTMTQDYNPNAHNLPDDVRLTRLGRILRIASLDELPTLINIIKGEMSLVGPRPLLMEYLDRYAPEQARRHEVKPGITGWAQVNGRNAITWEEKFKYDVWYIDNWSLWLDIKVIFMTIIKVIKGEGISQPGYATMEEFKGG